MARPQERPIDPNLLANQGLSMQTWIIESQTRLKNLEDRVIALEAEVKTLKGEE